MIRGIRGAITVEEDTAEQVLAAAGELMEAVLEANPSLRPGDVASAIFTLSPDLCSAYPARAARQLGWTDVPLMCAQEVPVPGGLARCIRLLLHWNTDIAQSEVRHVYLKGASVLRPDLTGRNGKMDGEPPSNGGEESERYGASS